MTMYKITNHGSEGSAEIFKNLTDEQLSLLKSITNELNSVSESYGPSIWIYEVNICNKCGDYFEVREEHNCDELDLEW